MSRSGQYKTKVARIIARLNIGGPAIQACYLHTALRADFDTILISGQLDSSEGNMSYLLPSEEGVQWLGSMSRPLRFWSDLSSFVQLVRLLRREKPDIVHTHTAKAGALGRIAARVARVPVVVHTFHGHIFRGEYFGRTATKTFLLIERLLARWTDVIIAVSPSQAHELSGQFHIAAFDKFRVIRNGYDLEPLISGEHRAAVRQEWKISDEEVLIVWAGRLVPVKNIDLLAAVIRAASAHPRLKFVVAGGGTERNRLESLVRDCHNVRLAGWSTNMARVWAAADIAIVTSKNEGTPSALIEAMAAGLPVVSTAAGGVRDLMVGRAETPGPGIVKFENGMLVDATPDAFVSALTALADVPELRRKLGVAGRKFALANFSQERLASDMARLYRALLSDTRSRGQLSSAAAG